MEEKLTTIENDGWELDDGEAIHQEHPDTFWIPELNKRENLKPDQIVKLIFRISTIDKSGNREISIERMWVIVKGVLGDSTGVYWTTTLTVLMILRQGWKCGSNLSM